MITDETMQGIAAEHGRVRRLSARVDGEDFQIAVKVPSRAEFKRLVAATAKAEDAQGKQEELENFLLRHRVYPDTGEWDRMLDDAPGLVETFANKLLEICGLNAEVTAKKY